MFKIYLSLFSFILALLCVFYALSIEDRIVSILKVKFPDTWKEFMIFFNQRLNTRTLSKYIKNNSLSEPTIEKLYVKYRVATHFRGNLLNQFYSTL